MSKRTILLISMGVFGALCWTATTMVCAAISGHRLSEAIVGLAERTVLVEREDLESEPGIVILDANNPVFKVEVHEPNHFQVKWEEGATEMEGPTCRVKQLGRGLTRVMGKVGDGEYPVIIDSGLTYNMIVNDAMVLECGLAIHPLAADPQAAGLCHVPRLEIGDMAIVDRPCLYTLRHYERKLFGRTKWVERDIVVGLRLMKSFRYILIDGIAGEVEFCGGGSFEPDPNDSWPHYAMHVVQKGSNLERLMVTMPLAGETREVMLDTGADCGMLVCADKWQTLSGGLNVVKQLRQGARMRDGLKRLTVMTVESMNVGATTIERAAVHVMADEEAAEDYFLLGMGYFTDTVIVLDFVHSLLWVKSLEE